MSLGLLQESFSRKLPKLYTFLHENGYEIRTGEAFRDPRVHGHWGEKMSYASKHSVHKLKIAIDLFLTKDGVFLVGAEARKAHTLGHDFWDSIGGGERIEHDLNHYSLEYQGFR
jgi:hypothetical protein